VGFGFCFAGQQSSIINQQFISSGLTGSPLYPNLYFLL
jgi:hypothetical protein